MKPVRRTDVIAALLWDVPALNASKLPGAKAFVASMTTGSLAWDSAAESPQDALGVAALGLQLAVDGSSNEALTVFDELLRHRSLTGFLGWNLVAWVSQDPEAPLERAEWLLHREHDPTLKARLFCKLATIALDDGRGDLAWRYLTSAAGLASGSTRLGMSIRIVLANEFGSFDDIRAARDSDDLTDLPWIVEAGANAGREALVQNVLRRSESGSAMTTFRYGPTVVDKILSAERQATWVGALWMRRQLRLQLGATLLAGGAESPDRWAYGCAMWILGHGEQVWRVIDSAEPHFDSDSCDVMLRKYLRHLGRGYFERHTQIEVLGAVWDLVSDDTASQLVKQFPMPSLTNPMAEQNLQVLNALALRAPDDWRRRVEDLSAEERGLVLKALRPVVLLKLPKRVATRVRKWIEEDGAEIRQGNLALALATIGEAPDAEREFQADLANAPPQVVAEIANNRPDVLTPRVLNSTIRKLRDQVDDERLAAEKGTWNVGGVSARRLLGTLESQRASSESRRATLKTLLAVVESPRAPTDMRVEAAVGLWSIALRNPMSRAIVARLRRVEVQNALWNLQGGTSTALLEMAILGALASSGLQATERDLLVAKSRDPDAVIRRTAIRAATDSGDAALRELALLAGLYDPNDDVVLGTLAALAEMTKSAEGAKATRIPGLEERLEALFATSGREVRAQVMVVAAKLPRASLKHRPVGDLLRRGRVDRSWMVREASRAHRPVKSSG